jgi:hypothetical protein
VITEDLLKSWAGECRTEADLATLCEVWEFRLLAGDPPPPPRFFHVASLRWFAERFGSPVSIQLPDDGLEELRVRNDVDPARAERLPREALFRLPVLCHFEASGTHMVVDGAHRLYRHASMLRAMGRPMRLPVYMVAYDELDGFEVEPSVAARLRALGGGEYDQAGHEARVRAFVEARKEGA